MVCYSYKNMHKIRIKNILTCYKSFIDDPDAKEVDMSFLKTKEEIYTKYTKFLVKQEKPKVKYKSFSKPDVIDEDYMRYFSTHSFSPDYREFLMYVLEIFVPKYLIQPDVQLDKLTNLHILTRYVLSFKKSLDLFHGIYDSISRPYYLAALKVISLIYHYLNFKHSREVDELKEKSVLKRELLKRLLSVVSIEILRSDFLKPVLKQDEELFLNYLEANLYTFDFLRIFEKGKILLSLNIFLYDENLKLFILKHLDKDLNNQLTKYSLEEPDKCVIDNSLNERVAKLYYIFNLAYRVYYPNIPNPKYSIYNIPDSYTELEIETLVEEFNLFFNDTKDAFIKNFANRLFIHMLSTYEKININLVNTKPNIEKFVRLISKFEDINLNSYSFSFLDQKKQEDDEIFNKIKDYYLDSNKIESLIKGIYIDLDNSIDFFKNYSFFLLSKNPSNFTAQSIVQFYLFLIFKYSDLDIYFHTKEHKYFSREFISIIQSFRNFQTSNSINVNLKDRNITIYNQAVGIASNFNSKAIKVENETIDLSFNNFYKNNPSFSIVEDNKIVVEFQNITFVSFPNIQTEFFSKTLELFLEFENEIEREKFVKISKSNEISKILLKKENLNTCIINMIFNNLKEEKIKLQSFNFGPIITNPFIQSDLGTFEVLMNKLNFEIVQRALIYYYKQN